jgi:hypothetical protein
MKDAKGRFLPGTGGRPPGTRNKLQGSFVKALADDFAEHGPGVIRIVRAEEPTQYLKIIASVIPKEFLLTDDRFSGLTEEELDEVIDFAKQELARANVATVS